MAKLASMFAVHLLLLLASVAFAQEVDSFTPIDNFANEKCCGGRTISVTGAGKRSFPTSIAVINLGVEATRVNAREAQMAVANKSANLTAYLKGQNVDKLQTTGVSLSANRNFTASPATIVGYTGSNSVSFEVPVKRAGVLLDGSVNNGASKINGVSFKATPEVSDAARKMALADATRSARSEAEVVAAALGGGVREAKTVKIVDAFVREALPQPEMASAAFGARAMAASASVVEGGESSVSARVSIVFVLYPST